MSPDSPSALPRFARGFVLSDPALPQPMPGWATREVAGLRLAHAADVPLATARSGRHLVTVIGHLVDTGTWRPTADALEAAVAALARSEDEFLDLTDAWSGRYLVIFGTDVRRRVMTDATGMRAAFYATEGPFVLASHAALVATMTGAPESAVLEPYRETVRARRSRVAMCMPGRSTPWSGVVHLTANLVLDVESRDLRRIFPRRPLPQLSAREAAALIAPRLRGQVSALVDTGRPVALSLTAGHDSRVSLAASRPVRDSVSYFTYRQAVLAENDWDVEIAGAMAKRLRLPYRVLDITPADEAPDLVAAIHEATFLSHGRSLVGAYRRTFRPDTIHIRSNIAEVGRASYRHTREGAAIEASSADIPAESLARAWAHGPASEPIVAAFAEWLEVSRLRDATGLDPLDLLYWENRMSCWHSSVVLESDFAFDTHVLFNARTILEQMLSVPPADRRHATSHHLISILWPELLRWPVGRRAKRAPLVPWRRRLGSVVPGRQAGRGSPGTPDAP